MSGSLDGSPRKGPTPGHLSRFGSLPWSQTDVLSSSVARASAPPAFDTQGKLNRRVWVLEQQLKEAEASIDAEKAISQGLRDRVTELESGIRAAEAQVREAEDRKEQALRDLEGQVAAQASQHVGLAAQLEDVKDSWRKEKVERAKLEAEVDRLRAARVELGAEQTHTPRKVLQPHSTNVGSVQTPITPTKPRHLAVAKAGGEALPPTPKRSPSKSIAAHYAHLEEQHQQLRAEYRKLHARYLEDLRHWKEYKVAETARIDAKKQRRAAKREAKESAENKENVAMPPVSQDQRPEARPSTVPDASVRPAEGDTADNAHEEEADTARSASQTRSSQPRSSQISEEGVYDEEEAVVILPQRRSSQRIRSQSQRTPKAASPVKTRSSVKREPATPEIATPTEGSSSRVRLPRAGRTTPWLGKDQTPSKISPITRSKRKARIDYDDEDIFGDEEDESLATPNDAVRTPLVRDRGVGADTSLRTSTLRRTAAKPDMAAESSTSRLESGRKRKLVDLENASPAEKAAELKRLSKMTSKQRREYYAEYKGSGRYLAPEEVRYGVYDDYEIDPAENEGERYQFHDVKRQRTERKQMHGGDCECCQAYYQAVGPIPRFNQAPKWKDESKNDEAEASRDAEMREHQNQVSRHRETWRRPPTPPGYWDIGFPGTQLVQEQNELADEMLRKKEAEIHREAKHKDSKWRKKKGLPGDGIP